MTYGLGPSAKCQDCGDLIESPGLCDRCEMYAAEEEHAAAENAYEAHVEEMQWIADERLAYEEAQSAYSLMAEQDEVPR